MSIDYNRCREVAVNLAIAHANNCVSDRDSDAWYEEYHREFIYQFEAMVYMRPCSKCFS